MYRLVHVEKFETVYLAIAREKQLKKRNRDRKIRLIKENNLDWQDLAKLRVPVVAGATIRP